MLEHIESPETRAHIQGLRREAAAYRVKARTYREALERALDALDVAGNAIEDALDGGGDAS